MRAISSLAGPRALAAFGRNDIRGTYRDPLLVMLVIAPVIWTTGVALLTPLFTEMLARRYGFDLVGYYPLILTAFLLLTSIIVAGALAAFLVLDDVDAGTMTALRVTPVPLSVFFGYRAATVMVVTTIYVVATMSCSGILEPGLVSSLIPIGLVAGLSAVVTLLLILAVANNKIQGLAMVRALGMLIAGLPCLSGSSVPTGTSRSASYHRTGLPRHFGSPAITAPGGRISSGVPSTTWPSSGCCFGAFALSTRERWRLAEHEVPQPQVDRRQHERDRGHHRALAGELPERDGSARAPGDSEHDDIGAGSHGGQVAAEVGA